MTLTRMEAMLALVCIVLCLVNFCDGGTRGLPCPVAFDCDGGTTCTSDICVCDTDGSYYYVKGTCFPRHELGEQCYKGVEIEGTQCIDSNAECAADANQGIGFSCQCVTSHFASGTSCVEIQQLGGKCAMPSGSASDACSAPKAECTGDTCQCSINYYKSGDNQCSQVQQLDENCDTPSGSASDACSAQNAECTGGTCQCSSNYYKSGDNQCSQVQQLDGNCAMPSEIASDACSAPNAECTGGTCQCSSTYYKSGLNQCSQVQQLGGNCAMPSGSASDACSAPNAECTGGTCQCSSNYYKSGDNQCSQVQQLGGNCAMPSGSASDACSAPNAECTGGTCQCSSTYYKSGDNQCIQVQQLGGNCAMPSGSASDACSAQNAECTGGNCQCSSNYYKSGDNQCSQVQQLGGNCAMPSGLTSDACSAPNSECTGSTCQCSSYYYKSGDNQCSPVQQLGGNCAMPSGSASDACSAQNAECTGGTCQCSSNYYRSGDNQCSQVQQLDGNCAMPSRLASDACSAPNAECTGSTCQCSSNYYKSGDNQCSQVQQLGGNCAMPSGLASFACSAPNAECTGNTCQCSSTYYKSGLNQCSQVQQLDGSCATPSGPASDACSAQNAECTGGSCQCSSNYYKSGVDQCSQVQQLDGNCDVPSGPASDACSAPNSECTGGTCQCSSNYFKFRDNQCSSDNSVALGSSCPGFESSVGSTTYCFDRNARCSQVSGSYRCQCTVDYFVNIGTCIADNSLRLGDQCPNSEAVVAPSEYCSDTNARCSTGNKCECLSTHYDSNTVSTLGGTCEEKVQLDQLCPQLDACESSLAVCTSGTCLCGSSYYDNNGVGTIGGECVNKAGLGSICPMPDACSTNGAECSGNTCKCESARYDTNTENQVGGSCNPKRQLNGACDSTFVNVNPKQCIDDKASCSWDSPSYTCSCVSGYYQSGLNCIANKTLGDFCTAGVKQCSDQNADCLDSKCTCKQSYYDDNGFPTGGNCQSVDDLKVSGINFPTVQISQMEVSWTAPSVSTTLITRYLVEWETKDNTISGMSKNSATTSTTITNLAAGKAYIVTITTINENTRSGHIRSALMNAEHAAKPNRPPSLDISSSNFNVINSRIVVAWNAPSGAVSGYLVKLFDGNTKVSENDKSSSIPRTANMYYANMKNGYTYTVNIVSKSELFGNGNTKYVQSTEFVTTIKTVVTVPGPPTNVACEMSHHDNITLSWTEPEPEFRNGDLKQYTVKVYSYPANEFVLERNTVTRVQEFVVDGLSPGKTYKFKVHTENEVYNSTSAGSPSQFCTTQAKKVDPPQNLLVSAIESRKFTVSWDPPAELYSEENLGYVLQVKSGNPQTCDQEIIYRCSNCQQQIPSLEGLCPSDKSTTIQQLSTVLKNDQLAYDFEGLIPYTMYFISVAAVNNDGIGAQSTSAQTTLEEVPQRPYNVRVTDVGTTSFKVTWEINGDRPGQVTYTIQLTAATRGNSLSYNVTGFENTEYLVSDVEEYWNYSVTVMAKTSVGSSEQSDTEEVMTLPAAPGPVSDFNFETSPGGDYTKIKVTWKAPTLLQRNSIIKQFVFNTNATTSLTNILWWNSDDEYVYTREVNVQPESTYSFEVYAVNTEETDSNGVVVNNIIMAPAGVPRNDVEETQNVQVVTSGSKGEKTISLNISEDFFNQETYGTIRTTGLIGCASAQCDFTTLRGMPLADFNTMDNWQKANGKGYTTYRITKASWITDVNINGNRERRATGGSIGYTVGVETCGNNDDYCNGELKEDTEYIYYSGLSAQTIYDNPVLSVYLISPQFSHIGEAEEFIHIRIVVVACTNGGCLLSKEYGPFKTEAVPTTSTPIGMIVGIVVGVVVVAAIVVVVIFFIRRRQSFPRHMSNMHNLETGDKIEDVTQHKINRPMLLNNLYSKLGNKHKESNDSNILISAEYESIDMLLNNLDSKLGNKHKDSNDSNILISAEYEGYSSPREYIGCQGPSAGTIDDFWKMTWKQNVHVIVMLTMCKEGQNMKFEQYWPDKVRDPKQYGDVMVEVTSYLSIKPYDYRMFKLTKGNVSRVVKHFHFPVWQELQGNVNHDIIINFIKSVRNHIQPPDITGPSIIHCSAEVGRVGTYIALDRLMQSVNNHDFSLPIDVYNLVFKMGMVQTEQQYNFIHDCVKEMLEERRSLDNGDNNTYEILALARDENIYASVHEQEPSLYENERI